MRGRRKMKRCAKDLFVLSLLPLDLGQQQFLPALGAVDVAGP